MAFLEYYRLKTDTGSFVMAVVSGEIDGREHVGRPWVDRTARIHRRRWSRMLGPWIDHFHCWWESETWPTDWSKRGGWNERSARWECHCRCRHQLRCQNHNHESEMAPLVSRSGWKDLGRVVEPLDPFPGSTETCRVPQICSVCLSDAARK